MQEFVKLIFSHRSCYIAKNDQLYVQLFRNDKVLKKLENGMSVTFILGRSVKVFGQISKITSSGFYIKDWYFNS